LQKYKISLSDAANRGHSQFYSRNNGVFGKMTPESVNRQLKKYAAIACRSSADGAVQRQQKKSSNTNERNLSMLSKDLVPSI
jgi:hypothetical protein